MSKTPKPKTKTPSIHSRAAKRTTPHPLSHPLSSLPRHTTTSTAIAHSTTSGIVKRKTKTKRLSRQKRIRKEAAIDKAGAVADRLEAKVGRSLERGGWIKARGADWDDLNERIEEEVAKVVERAATVAAK